jgi:CheY-like chemotaxis protein
MNGQPTMVLLVGDNAKGSIALLQWLKKRGCLCQTARSYRDACDLISSTPFDLVLSEYQLPDRTAFPLLEWLIKSPATLFFCTRVQDGSLWLKMLERGERCIGTAVLRSNDFVGALDKAVAMAGSYEKETVSTG